MASGSEPNPKSTTGSISDNEAARLWRTFLNGGNPQGLAAFDQLYVGFLPVVVRYCRFHLRHAHLAEDVAHTVFVRLLETRPVLKSSFTGLLLRTARNMCASELGRRRPGDPVPLESLTQPDADPSGELERQDDHAALADCLNRLPERDRTLVVLRHGEGLTYRQIADSLGLRVAFSTISRRLKRIKAQLLRCLKEKNYF